MSTYGTVCICTYIRAVDTRENIGEMCANMFRLRCACGGVYVCTCVRTFANTVPEDVRCEGVCSTSVVGVCVRVSA